MPQFSLECDQASYGNVTLIAPRESRKAIQDVLGRNGITFDTFESVQEMLGLEAYEPVLVVLWVADVHAGLARGVERVRRTQPKAKVVVVATEIERWAVRAALVGGAAGVVEQDDIAAALCPCVRAVEAGQICVPREYGRQVEPPVLSTREKQILGLVVMGYMNAQIAEQLFLAESTVKSHLSSAFGKLGVRSRNEAVDLIVNPDRGLGMGILGLGGEPVEPVSPLAG